MAGSILNKAAKHACAYAYFDIEQLIQDDINKQPKFRDNGLGRKIPFRVRHYAAKQRLHQELQKIPASTFVSAFFGQSPRDLDEALKGVSFTTYLKRFVGWPGRHSPLYLKLLMPLGFLWHLTSLPLKVAYNTAVLFTECLPHTLSKVSIWYYRQQKNKFRPLITISAIFNLIYCAGRAITSPYQTANRLWRNDHKAGAYVSGAFTIIAYTLFTPLALALVATSTISLLTFAEGIMDRAVYQTNKAKKVDSKLSTTTAKLIEKMPPGTAPSIEKTRHEEKVDPASQPHHDSVRTIEPTESSSPTASMTL